MLCVIFLNLDFIVLNRVYYKYLTLHQFYLRIYSLHLLSYILIKLINYHYQLVHENYIFIKCPLVFQKTNYNYLIIIVKFQPIHMFKHQIHQEFKLFLHMILV